MSNPTPCPLDAYMSINAPPLQVAQTARPSGVGLVQVVAVFMLTDDPLRAAPVAHHRATVLLAR